MRSEAEIRTAFEALLGGEPGDPYAVYRAARSEAPVFHSDATGGWVVARRQAVFDVLTDEDHFGPLAAGAGSSASHGRTILHMSGEEHRKKLAPISHRIRRPATLKGELGVEIETITRDLIDAMPDGEPFDLKRGFTTPQPLTVTARLMALPDAPMFRDWYDDIVAAGASNLRGDPDVAARGVEARKNLSAWLEPIIAERRANPGDDLLSDLCNLEWQGSVMSTDEVVSFCSFILAAGVETTARALSSLLKRLVSVPQEWERLDADRDLIPAACAEILRWAPPVHGISRGVRADTRIEDVEMKAGERVLVLLGSANRDEALFDDPESFVLDRFVDNPRKEFTPKSSILPFGGGTHHCTGSLLALEEMVVGMNGLLDRVESIEWANGVPDDVGYVLRSPVNLPVRLRMKN
jgi:cytochrome P450